jgi:hypothetical protein
MRKSVKIAVLTLFFSLLALLLIGIGYQIWYTEFRIPTGVGRWTSESPDSRFTVTAYSNKGLRSLIPTMPGDGGYGPGIIILREKKTGNILHQRKVDNLAGMLRGYVEWMVGEPDAPWRKDWAGLESPEPWKGDYVSIGLFGIWPLPSEDGEMPPLPSWAKKSPSSQ